MLGKTRGQLAQLAVVFAPEPADLSAILKLSAGRSSGDAAALLGKCEEGMIKCLSDIEESMARQEKALIQVEGSSEGRMLDERDVRSAWHASYPWLCQRLSFESTNFAFENVTSTVTSPPSV